MPTEMEDYLFDLRGFLVLRNAVTPEHIDEMNTLVDGMLPVEPDEWKGHIHCHRSEDLASITFRQVFEAGEPFERLIDQPSWINHIRRYVGGDDGLFIDQGWYNLRGPGGGSSLHSGAHKRRIRTQFRYHEGEFRCGQVNILLALNDIGPDDGPTMVVPGSHKSNRLHPAFERKDSSLDNTEEAIKAPLNAGDALLFVDCIAHGSAERKTEGYRRALVYRYGPHWGHSRYGYEPSGALLERLTPERRKIIQPIPPRRPPDQ
jgi:hypothetical protein